jgi:Flp pilus assembly protein TadG
MPPHHPVNRKSMANWLALRDDRAAQIVELAVSLPLLVVFVVGIFDFSGAFTLKQKLANAVRDGARSAAAAPASDLGNPSTTVPSSVGDAFRVVDNYLTAAGINDCGLSGATGGPPSGPLTWTYTATGNGCPSGGTLTLTINRGYLFQQTGGSTTGNCVSTAGQGVPAAVVGTCVGIQYPYQWRFNRVITLLVKGANYAGVTNISTNAVALNEN